MNFQPLEDRIACQLIEQSTKDGIQVVSFDDREDLCNAKVLAVGPQCQFVQPGQTILVPRFAIYQTEIDGETVTMTREAEVLALLTE